MHLRSLVSVVALVLSPARAAAHGVPPAAIAVLAGDAQGVSLVRLSQGMAYRSEEGFRFLCPEAWGGDTSAPSATLPDGATLIGDDGLFVVEADGHVSPHPELLGATLALADNGTALFGLFQRGSQVELRRVERETSELVRAFDEPFDQLAASEGKLWLLRFSQRTLVLQRVALDGALEESVRWEAPSNVSSASLRAQAGELYVLVWGTTAPWVTLGRIAAGAYESLGEAQAAIAGPLAFPDAALIARDGTLEDLALGVALSARDQHVTCVERHRGLTYACVGGGLRHVDARGLGAPLFSLSALREPDYQALPEARRAGCMLRWLDLQLHVREAEAPGVAAEGVDGGEPEPTAIDAGATIGARDASGCSLHGRSGRTLPTATLWLGLLLCARRRRSRSAGLPRGVRSPACVSQSTMPTSGGGCGHSAPWQGG